MLGMWSELMIIIGFIVLIIVLCKVWNSFMMKLDQKEERNKEECDLNFCIPEHTSKIILAGSGTDKNRDYPVEEAIDTVLMPKDKRIKLERS